MLFVQKMDPLTLMVMSIEYFSKEIPTLRAYCPNIYTVQSGVHALLERLAKFKESCKNAVTMSV